MDELKLDRRFGDYEEPIGGCRRLLRDATEVGHGCIEAEFGRLTGSESRERGTVPCYGPTAIDVSLLVTGFSVGTLALLGGSIDERADETAAVEVVDLSVRLDDEHDVPDAGNGTVQTCIGVGTPGDHVSMPGDVTVDVPAAANRKSFGERGLLVEVSFAHTTATVGGTGRRTTESSGYWLTTRPTLRADRRRSGFVFAQMERRSPT